MRLSDLEKIKDVEIDLGILKNLGIVPAQTQQAKLIKSGSLTRKISIKGIGVTKGCARSGDGCRRQHRRVRGRARLKNLRQIKTMANGTTGAGGMMPDLSKIGEVRNRVLFLIGALIVYRIGSFIPVPGIDPGKLAALFDQQKGTILDMFNMFSGGALQRLSIFALGVMPYISASIIVQLMASVMPQLKELRKEGESGKRKLTMYTRYGTLGLATFQSIGAAFRAAEIRRDAGAWFRIRIHRRDRTGDR